MSATPRPWSWFADVRKDGVKVARIGGGTPEDDLGMALKHDDANLIVTAVNEHDALLAKVAAYEVFVSEMKTALAHNGVWVPSMVIEAAIERAETGDQR